MSQDLHDVPRYWSWLFDVRSVNLWPLIAFTMQTPLFWHWNLCHLRNVYVIRWQKFFNCWSSRWNVLPSALQVQDLTFDHFKRGLKLNLSVYIGVMRSQRLVTVDSWRYINFLYVGMYIFTFDRCFPALENIVTNLQVI